MIYLDHAATTPVPREVADAMYAVLTEQFGNPSAQYGLGQEMKKQVEGWRKTVAGALGCQPEQLYFTACGTEGDNWAVTAACWQNRHLGRHIVTTAVEHHAVMLNATSMAKRLFPRISMIRMVSSKLGRELITSMIRIIKSSTQPPKWAIIAP